MSLYEIQHNLQALIAQLESTDDPLEYELTMSKLEALEMDREQKLEGCCCYVKNLRAEIETFANEIERLKQRMVKLQRREESFLQYMQSCLKVGEGWKKGTHVISWLKPKSVQIKDNIDWRDLGDDAFDYGVLDDEPVWKPDKIKIRQAIESGKRFEWAKLVSQNVLKVK